MRCSHCYGCMCIFIYVYNIDTILFICFIQTDEILMGRMKETKYWKKRKTRGKTGVCVRKIICSSNIWGLVIQMVYTFTIVARSFCRCNFPFITFTFSSFSHLIYMWQLYSSCLLYHSFVWQVQIYIYFSVLCIMSQNFKLKALKYKMITSHSEIERKWTTNT